MNKHLGESSMRIQTVIPKFHDRKESEEDKLAVSNAVAKASGNQYKESVASELPDIENGTKVSENTNELFVITKVKNLLLT